MQNNEQSVQNEIRLYLSECGIINFRTNVGSVKLADGRYFDTGLPKGHSDVYGVMPGGRAIFIECKKTDWKPAKPGTKLFEHEERQRKFLEAMSKQGAIAGFATCIDDIKKLGINI